MQIFAPSSRSPSGMLLSSDTPMLIEMVTAAARRLIAFCDKATRDGKQVSAYYAPDAEDTVVWSHFVQAMSIQEGSTPPSAQEVVLSEMECDVALLKEFASFINGRSDDESFPGEQWWTRRAVYIALIRAQEHQVALIKSVHALHGKHFGCALRYQRVGDAVAVRDWPSKKGWSIEALPFPVMPCDDPSYR